MAYEYCHYLVPYSISSDTIAVVYFRGMFLMCDKGKWECSILPPQFVVQRW